MKPILEEAIEQIRGRKQQQQKPQPKTTVGLKDQLAPGKAVSEALRQALGFAGEKKIPTTEELVQMKEEERKRVEEQIKEVEKDLSQEATKETAPYKKANIAVLNLPKPVQPQEPPPYIRGKPDYQPERQVKEAEAKKKHKLPPLVEPSTHPRRGSFTEYIERKIKGAEIKGGRE